ncbi:carbonic anhydrase 2-like [Apis dorsata]|uniref:carbonic anhydrase 2-like n=1 Tax=Apis dorsata TaxID=7462 RepID=UPI00129326BC|nr:carbonic anhydrase 2-like [Apis dorsata]
MAFLVFTLVLLSSKLVVGNFSYDGNSGPLHWGDEYKQCIGKFQSPIDIEEKDVTNMTFPKLQFSDTENSHVAYMINNGHTVMIRSFDPDLPTILGGPINNTYVFQQLHFHWGQNDNLGSEDLINNHSFSMELHAVFWKKQYGSYDKATEYSDGLTVLGYLYQVNIKSLHEVYTYFIYLQLAVFRKIQSSDGRNLTHNFRPVQPLDGRIVYRNVPTSMISGTTIITDSKQTTNSSKKLKPTKQSNEENSHKKDDHNGQQSMWTVSSFGVILGLIFLLQYQ